jgi:hypothetical protein
MYLAMKRYDALRISYGYWIDWIPRSLTWTLIAALHGSCALHLHWLGVRSHLFFTLIRFRLLLLVFLSLLGLLLFSFLYCFLSFSLLSLMSGFVFLHLEGYIYTVRVTIPPSHEVPAEMAFCLIFPHLYLFFPTRLFSCPVLARTDRITLY